MSIIPRIQVSFRLLLFCLLANCMYVNAQKTPAQIREERFNALADKMIYPLIKGSPLTGVLPVAGIQNQPDISKEVKLVFDFTQATTEGKQATKVNEGIEEVARILNLHAAAGIPKEKIKAVVVFHAASIVSVMNDTYYQQNFKTGNPNQPMLQQLLALGAQLVICGQSLQLRNMPATALLPGLQVALAAKTTLTKYEGEGYSRFEIGE